MIKPALVPFELPTCNNGPLAVVYRRFVASCARAVAPVEYRSAFVPRPDQTCPAFHSVAPCALNVPSAAVAWFTAISIYCTVAVIVVPVDDLAVMVFAGGLLMASATAAS